MADLVDYSGEFKPDLKMEEFSKDFLVNVMRAWSSAYLRLDECWHKEAVEKFGEEQAFSCQLGAWQRVERVSVPKIAKTLKIEVNDIVDFLKLSQLLPDGVLTGIFQSKYEIKNRNHVIVTITRCRTLEYLEKEDPSRIKTICHDIDIPMNQACLQSVLPQAKFLLIKLPDRPRKNQSEIPCIWELIG
jgi:hypothetical protein